MTEWKPGHELTHDALAATRYLFAIADGDLFAFDGETCINGLWTLSHIDGVWCITDVYGEDTWPVQWVMLVSKPTEG